MPEPIAIAVHGASGRMGQAILRLAFARPHARPVAALVGAGSASLGRPVASSCGDTAPDLRYANDLRGDPQPQVLIDFSTPDAFDRALALAEARRIAFLSGTTGLSAAQHAAMTRAARTIPLLWSANFSLGVAILTRLVGEAARLLADWDCEIVEAHHRNKKDAPSGTALALGRAVAAARGATFEQVARPVRAGISETARDPAEIGFSVMRGGDIVGEHSVLFLTAGERIELRHAASDRDVFARGALLAACELAGAQPGYHDLAEIIAQRAAPQVPHFAPNDESPGHS